MRVVHTDVLVIGGGLAGLRVGIGARRRGHEVLILSLVPPKRSHSAAAQGGMQASLGNTIKAFGDNEDAHFADTVRGSDWGADQRVVRMFVDTAPKAVRELAAWGVPWNRVQRGERETVIDGKRVTLVERDDAHGLITARNFGGTQHWRACFVSDGTGHAMLYTMSDQAIGAGIPVHERVEAIALIHADGRCYGAIARNLMTGELVAYTSRATCIATGGFGRIYAASTNAVINEGIGAAIVLETGVAPLANMEAVQFHPTALFPAGILVTEGCRGDGGVLLDKDQHRFMPDYEPEKMELASRDVVSRRMEEHIHAGNGVRSRFGEHLWLDIRLLGAAHIASNLREVKEICTYFLGIDPTDELIPVRPAQHYSMGGIRTDHRGESVGLRGLFAAGEAACWDLHGFNRLGGNSVAETVVAGMLVGEFIADFCDSQDGDAAISTALVRECAGKEQARLEAFVNGKDRCNPYALIREMRAIMTKNVGIFRDAPLLEEAVRELRTLLNRCGRLGIRNHSNGVNPELVAAYRLPRMLKLALCVAEGALARTESRGAHYRVDYPRRDDRHWLRRTLAVWPDDEAPGPQLDYEPLDVMAMGLPPGWRGYGARDFIEHPDGPRRQRDIDALLAAHPDLDRDARLDMLMPYQTLLPARYRDRNARLGDDEQ